MQFHSFRVFALGELLAFYNVLHIITGVSGPFLLAESTNTDISEGW